MNEPEKLSVERKVGQGSFANVFHIKRHCDHRSPRFEHFALKIIDQDRFCEDDRSKSVTEARLALRLNHQHIISCYDAFQFDSFLILVTELCPQGDMYCYLNNRKKMLPIQPVEELQIVKWIAEISSGLEYLHNLKILHRDIKTKNIFLQENLTVQIGDLGVAKQLDFTLAEANTFLGTPLYMSPEMFRFEPYSYKADIWSFGCCVYEMMTLEFAFESPSQKNMMYKVLHGELPSVPSIYSTNLAELAQSMMTNDPEDRPRASDIHKTAKSLLTKQIPPRQRRRLSSDVVDTVGDVNLRDTTAKVTAPDRRSVISALLAYFRENVSLGIHTGFQYNTFADSKTGLSKTVKSITKAESHDDIGTMFTRSFGISQQNHSNGQHDHGNSQQTFEADKHNSIMRGDKSDLDSNCSICSVESFFSQNVLSCCESLTKSDDAEKDRECLKNNPHDTSTVESQVSSVIRWAMENLASCNPDNLAETSDLNIQTSSDNLGDDSRKKVRRKKKSFLRAVSERRMSSADEKKNQTEIKHSLNHSRSDSNLKRNAVTLYTRSQKVIFKNSEMEELDMEYLPQNEDVENTDTEKRCEEELGKDLIFRACQLVQLLSDESILQAQLKELLGWRNYKKYRKQILKLAQVKPNTETRKQDGVSSQA